MFQISKQSQVTIPSDLINMNAFIKFDEIMSMVSKDIERKRNSDANQGP